MKKFFEENKVGNQCEVGACDYAASKSKTYASMPNYTAKDNLARKPVLQSGATFAFRKPMVKHNRIRSECMTDSCNSLKVSSPQLSSFVNAIDLSENKSSTNINHVNPSLLSNSLLKINQDSSSCPTASTGDVDDMPSPEEFSTKHSSINFPLHECISYHPTKNDHQTSKLTQLDIKNMGLTRPLIKLTVRTRLASNPWIEDDFDLRLITVSEIYRKSDQLNTSQDSPPNAQTNIRNLEEKMVVKTNKSESN